MQFPIYRFLAVALLLLTTAVARADITLIRDGKPVSEIVIAEDAIQSVRLAAEDLEKHLQLISSAEVPIVTEPTGQTESVVYVGRSTHTDKLGFEPAEFTSSGLEILAKDNYVILDGPEKQWRPSPYSQTRSDSLYLHGSIITDHHPEKPEDFPSPGLKAWQEFSGRKFSTKHLNNGPGALNRELGIYTNDDTGTWYAVSELLEQIGVRWYMPYENGTVIPELKTVIVKDQHLTRQAAFGKREYTYYGTMRDDAEGIAWFKRQKVGNWRMVLYNHTTYAIYSSYQQQQLHPEYLSKDSKGRYIVGYPSGRGMPRYAHPGFREAAVAYMNKVFEAQPDLTAMAVGPPDGGFKLDARDMDKYGKPGDTAEQKASNAVWDFHVFLANELKKSHPDKYLLYMSGAGARLFPTNIDKVPDNMLIPPRLANAPYRVVDAIDKASIIGHQRWLEHMSEVQRAPKWDHWLYYRRPSNPRYPVVFTQSLQEQFQHDQSFVYGKFIEIQPDARRDEDGRRIRRLGVPGLVHLMVYWQNKLFWDPYADRQAMLDEYYRLFFGPAEAQMRQFYEFAEQVWGRQESRSLTQDTGFLKEEDVDRYFEILAAARDKVEPDSVYDKRIATIEIEMQSLKKLFPNLKRTGPLVRAYKTPTPLEIDGELDEYRYGWHTLRDWTTGEQPAKNRTDAFVALTPDKSAMVVGAVCYENRMDNIKADCTTNDDFGIFQDDVVEVYVNTPQRSYFKIVVNPNGAVWTETTDVAIIDRDTLPLLWEPEVEVLVRKLEDRWIVEMKIPTDDFGDIGPTKTYPWGIQVGRTRFTGGYTIAHTLSPTGGKAYKTLDRWANLWMR